MNKEKPDYKIEIAFARHPGEHEVYAVVTESRSHISQEFAGKTVAAVLRQIAKWMDRE